MGLCDGGILDVLMEFCCRASLRAFGMRLSGWACFGLAHRVCFPSFFLGRVLGYMVDGRGLGGVGGIRFRFSFDFVACDPPTNPEALNQTLLLVYSSASLCDSDKALFTLSLKGLSHG